MDKLTSLQRAAATIGSYCADIARNADNSLLPPSSEMEQRIRTMNDPFEFSGMISACNAYIEQLRTDLGNMEREDYQYHNPPKED